MENLDDYLLESSPKQEILMLDAPALDIEEARQQWQSMGLAVRFLRGWKMQNLRDMYDQIESALQFPVYFGRNGAALDEVLRDFWWMPTDTGRVIILDKPDAFLVDEPDRSTALDEFVTSLMIAKRYWSQQDEPMSFNLVLAEVDQPTRVEELWAERGLTVHRSSLFATRWSSQN